MTPTAEARTQTPSLWYKVGWFGLLLGVCYAPVLYFLAIDWWIDGDMSHGFFVPAIAGYIVWQKRGELRAIQPKPNWWGLLLVLFGATLLMLGALGAELFTTRVAFVLSVIGVVWLLGGNVILKKLAFPLFLLFFMIPIPAIIYNTITFPLQIIASQLAAEALWIIGIPVARDGNILELPSQRLSVVEACSGIRSLLTLTFLSLVFGYFFEKRKWLRALLFVATVPIAILANGSRVTITGILSETKPELAEGFFHESTGWVIFMIALGILLSFHQIVLRMVTRVPSKGKA